MTKNLHYIIGVLLAGFIVTGGVMYFMSQRDDASWTPGAKYKELPKPFVESSAMDGVGGKEEMESEIQLPLERAIERVTKKPFGIYISPKNSPVSPERFSGFHTGVDFEVFPEELEAEVKIPVRSICSGKILLKRSSNGYGGVVAQSCILENISATVIYGHLNLKSIPKDIGDDLASGERIGILGNGYSAETDGERKHLHLGIHKGSEINLLGYVQNESELSDWIDPCSYVCSENARQLK